jgi:ankyrin repeat protein
MEWICALYKSIHLISFHVQNGWSALHFASKAGYLNVVKLLVETGASPRLENANGKVAVTFAAAANHSDVLSYLMKKDHSTQTLMDDKKVSIGEGGMRWGGDGVGWGGVRGIGGGVVCGVKLRRQ